MGRQSIAILSLAIWWLTNMPYLIKHPAVFEPSITHKDELLHVRPWCYSRWVHSNKMK